ncbi:MAG: DUF2817 domain-containing protein [Deltaproteobacteria bacterium]|nr:DUF2817 domain-containing protein [Deltaproteobacteria bacterium]
MTLLWVASAAAFDMHDEDAVEIEIQITDRAQLDRLIADGYNVTGRDGDIVRLRVDSQRLDLLYARGFSPKVLPAPEKAFGYYDYDSMVDQIEEWESTYPGLVQVTELGPTQGGTRSVWMVKISDNVTENEAEPRVIFDGSIHGDEQIAEEVVMEFMDRLLSGYASADEYGALVDDFEMYFVPIVNPDGFEVPRRTNSRGVDLNRNFPINWNGGGSDPASEAEVRAMTDWYIESAAALAIQYHSGSEVVNYPLDSTPQPAPDEPLYISLSNLYGDIADYPITNGYDWYKVEGISEETSYMAAGTMSVIVEISNTKTPSSNQIDGYTDRNALAMLAWVERANEGLTGLVTDASTGDPLEAVVTVESLWHAYTDPAVGDYYRVLSPGDYTVRFHANGYIPREIDATVDTGEREVLNVALSQEASDPKIAAIRPIETQMERPFTGYANESLPKDVVGLPDAVAYSVGKGGVLVVDMGASIQLDGVRPLVVYENDTDGVDGYALFAGADWQGPWTKIGDGSGTSSFLLTSPAMRQRYLRIEDDDDGSAGGETPGADIDAVVQAAGCLAPAVEISADTFAGDAPLSVQFASAISAVSGCVDSLLWNFGDGDTSTSENPSHTFDAGGEYIVTLIVQGQGGSGSDSVTIDVFGAGDDDDDDTGGCGQ